ncbi:MAG TPA: alkaline phosphatase family protein [Ktedonobacteraceae bacterium]|nr:alkaline phosphatase family protein [Ktedonobacteraceae bacterium]
MRSVILGADGLTFRILHPLMERGELPNFQKLTQEGCEAILESKYPPLTPPAWISLSTGVKPARHGVYDFWEYEEQEQEQQESGTPLKARVMTHRKDGKAIWNILSEYGKQVLVINVPMTYPPEPINGYMVSGYMTPGSEVEFTYPPAFKEELFEAVPDYLIDLENQDVFGGKKNEKGQRLIDTVLRMTEKRIELLKYMLKEKPWDFCYVVFVGPDRLQHSLWDEITSFEPAAIEYYRQLDSALGFLLEQLAPDDTLFIVSDHGFQGASRLFDINEYLYSKKLLAMRSNEQRKRANRLSAIKQALRKIGLLTLARKARKSLARRGIPTGAQHLSVYKPLLDELDRERTLAYVPSHSGFPSGFANIFLSPKMSAEQIEELCADLKRQVDPRTGKALVDAIYTAEVFGSGPFAPGEPHLLVLPNDGMTFRMTLGNKWLWDDATNARDANKRFGVHFKDGVLYAYGGGIKHGYKAPNAEVFDLVPTVLHSMGLPLPHAFDGRVLDELFVERTQEEQLATAEKQGGEGGSGLARRKLKKLQEV